ncbi:MAG: ferritin-like domain-containing protein [Methylococcaceae bacterium]
MPQTSTPTPQNLFKRLRSSHDDRAALQEAAQLAIQVEFTTIPAYLTALYSISQSDSNAYQLLRSVVIEEMFHVNQAANLLVAIGGKPRFTEDYTPTYPCYLPQANTNTTPYIGLYRASVDVFANVFTAIETPAPSDAPPEGDNYNTIAQLYGALQSGLQSYNGSQVLFESDHCARQRKDIYLGKFGGKPVEVTNMETANLAITEIVQQGEGSVPSGKPLNPTEKWGAYNHYGLRTDLTYGPIIGKPNEMSHFMKFRAITQSNDAFPSTYPIISNPKREYFTNPMAVELAKCFDYAYSIMLQALERTFVKPKCLHGRWAEVDPYFTVALPLMHYVLPNLARTLMTTPAYTDGDSAVGPNAAPTFLYEADANIDSLRKSLEESIDAIRQYADPSTRDTQLIPLLTALEYVQQLTTIFASN